MGNKKEHGKKAEKKLIKKLTKKVQDALKWEEVAQTYRETEDDYVQSLGLMADLMEARKEDLPYLDEETKLESDTTYFVEGIRISTAQGIMRQLVEDNDLVIGGKNGTFRDGEAFSFDPQSHEALTRDGSETPLPGAVLIVRGSQIGRRIGKGKERLLLPPGYYAIEEMTNDAPQENVVYSAPPDSSGTPNK